MAINLVDPPGEAKAQAELHERLKTNEMRMERRSTVLPWIDLGSKDLNKQFNNTQKVGDKI